MKNITVLTRSPLAKERDIDAFENEYGIQFPPFFKTFLLEINARNIKEQVFTKGDREFWVHGFLPFENGYELSFQRIYHLLEDHFEKKYIAFAFDPGNWMFVISIKEDDFGQIYFCRMDEELEYALTFLANDFNTFLKGLKFCED